MPGPRVDVVVKGPGLPDQGKRCSGYKTVCNELQLDRSKSDRHTDREKLKHGESLILNDYTITRSN